MLLKELMVGDSARVLGFVEGNSAYRRKLLAMGLTPGTELSITRLAPMGDPVEIRVRGFALTLRKHEADALSVEKVS